MAVLLPRVQEGVKLLSDPGVQDYAVDATTEYDADLPFKSRALDVGVGGNVRLWLWGNETYAASGQIIFGSISGSVGAVINGVTITVATASYATTTLAASALVAAINASTDPDIQGLVYASNTTPLTRPAGTDADAEPVIGTAPVAGVTITVWWHNPSPDGDAITLVASGTGVTVSGATLDGSAGSTLYKNWPSGAEKAKRIRQILAADTTAETLVIVR